MESSKATVILKITRASPKYTKDQTVQAKIEDGLFEDIKNLHRKNKRVTSLIIYWKVVNYIQCSKVGQHQDITWETLEIGFIMDSSVTFNCLTQVSLEHHGNYPGFWRKKLQDVILGWEGANKRR